MRRPTWLHSFEVTDSCGVRPTDYPQTIVVYYRHGCDSCASRNPHHLFDCKPSAPIRNTNKHETESRGFAFGNPPPAACSCESCGCICILQYLWLVAHTWLGQDCSVSVYPHIPHLFRWFPRVPSTTWDVIACQITQRTYMGTPVFTRLGILFFTPPPLTAVTR